MEDYPRSVDTPVGYHRDNKLCVVDYTREINCVFVVGGVSSSVASRSDSFSLGYMAACWVLAVRCFNRVIYHHQSPNVYMCFLSYLPPINYRTAGIEILLFHILCSVTKRHQICTHTTNRLRIY